MKLTVLPGEYSVWRLAADAPLPFVETGQFLSITRTSKELSVVSASAAVPTGAQVESGWRCLEVEGPLAFHMTGVIAELSSLLAAAGVPLFVVSTYDTDYLLVKQADLGNACAALCRVGHLVDA